MWLVTVYTLLDILELLQDGLKNIIQTLLVAVIVGAVIYFIIIIVTESIIYVFDIFKRYVQDVKCIRNLKKEINVLKKEVAILKKNKKGTKK